MPRSTAPWNHFCIHCFDYMQLSFIEKYGLCEQCYSLLRRKHILDSGNIAYEEDPGNKFQPEKMVHLFDNLYFDRDRKALVHIVTSKNKMPSDKIINTFKTLYKERPLFEICDQDGTIINRCHPYNGDKQVDRNEVFVEQPHFIDQEDEEARQRAIAEFDAAVGYKEPVTPEQEEAEKEVDALFNDLKKRKNENKHKD